MLQVAPANIFTAATAIGRSTLTSHQEEPLYHPIILGDKVAQQPEWVRKFGSLPIQAVNHVEHVQNVVGMRQYFANPNITCGATVSARSGGLLAGWYSVIGWQCKGGWRLEWFHGGFLDLEAWLGTMCLCRAAVRRKAPSENKGFGVQGRVGVEWPRRPWSVRNKAHICKYRVLKGGRTSLNFNPAFHALKQTRLPRPKLSDLTPNLKGPEP